ncbi:MAG: hypothetical protein RBT63_07545 [Bdellovibrionales bacterium]|nr:hypothetical protein [Bdellovibrionales bacterium]
MRKAPFAGGVVGLATLLAVLLGYSLWKQNAASCGLDSNIQIILKEHHPEALQNAIYSIKSGAIEGEAFLTSAPTSSIGHMMVSSQIVVLKTTVENMRAPYAGHITAVIECKARKYMKERTVPFGSEETQLILTVATGRRIFGVCAIEEAKYASAFWAGYDEQHRQVVTVKLFKPVSDLDMIEQSQEDIAQVLLKMISQPRWYSYSDSCSALGGIS